jgi:hypothetical protein
LLDRTAEPAVANYSALLIFAFAIRDLNGMVTFEPFNLFCNSLSSCDRAAADSSLVSLPALDPSRPPFMHLKDCI